MEHTHSAKRSRVVSCSPVPAQTQQHAGTAALSTCRAPLGAQHQAAHSRCWSLPPGPPHGCTHALPRRRGQSTGAQGGSKVSGGGAGQVPRRCQRVLAAHGMRRWHPHCIVLNCRSRRTRRNPAAARKLAAARHQPQACRRSRQWSSRSTRRALAGLGRSAAFRMRRPRWPPIRPTELPARRSLAARMRRTEHRTSKVGGMREGETGGKGPPVPSLFYFFFHIFLSEGHRACRPLQCSRR